MIIDTTQPISMENFIARATEIYYATRVPFGEEGDFITAPEISQLFGEAIGVWLIRKWLALNKPKKIIILEIGAGRGIMMLDILRSIKHITPLYHALHRIYIIENSKNLRQIQEKNLNQYLHKIYWFDHINQIEWVEECAIFCIANEFFDALPIQQFYREEEIFIHNNRKILSKQRLQIIEEEIIEYAPQRIQYLQHIIENIKLFMAQSLLIIDYGYTKNIGNTVQAILKHQKVDPILYAGIADITSLVNFTELITVLQKHNIHYQLSSQNHFLQDNGIYERAQLLIANGADHIKIKNQLFRLLDDTQMGSLFLVLETSILDYIAKLL